MKKSILLILLWPLMYLTTFGQASGERVIYIVDSIPVMEDPEKGNEILQSDIAGLVVVKDKEKLKHIGYEQFDGVIYVFTKEYRNRPEQVSMQNPFIPERC